jgi:hypothetical protein
MGTSTGSFRTVVTHALLITLLTLTDNFIIHWLVGIADILVTGVLCL